jgi:DNA-binding CsgD family transcriptional regulator
MASDATKPSWLSPRRLQIARLAAEGLANAEIARQLGLPRQTVKNAMCAIFDYLGVRSRPQLLILILYRGWVDLAEVGPVVEAQATAVAAINRELAGLPRCAEAEG